MHVNKLPLLPPSQFNFPWLVALRNDLYRTCTINNTRRKSDSAHCMLEPRGSCPHHLLQFQQRQVLNKSFAFGNISNSKYKNLSRYSASTIMRPHSKEFSFDDYDVIGFDLDGTILRYNLENMVPLEYELICRYLVEHKGYSKELLTKPSEMDFVQKGLFLDAERGNLLKLDHNGCILKASHGTTPITVEEINKIYGNDKQWSVTQQFIDDPMCAWNGPLADKVRSLLDYFDIGVSLVFAHAVDEIDAVSTTKTGPYTIWADILEALINNYTRENFSNGKSGYFESLKSDPDRYLLRTSPAVIDWLQKLKAARKKLYLLTGSHIDFANFTATYALGADWKELFDNVICFARKPGFFLNTRQYHRIEDFRETDPIDFGEKLELNKVYSMGNWKQLQQLFAQSLNKDVSELKSLYVGDNLIQDVYAPDALAGIDSITISEEMLGESATESQSHTSYKTITSSRYWNSYFFDDGVPTLWTHIINKHSKMCVPTLEHAASKPINHNFKMNNEIGFYPSPPVLID